MAKIVCVKMGCGSDIHHGVLRERARVQTEFRAPRSASSTGCVERFAEDGNRKQRVPGAILAR